MRAVGWLTEPLVKVVAQWAALVLCSGAGPYTNDRAAHQGPPGVLGLFPAAAGRCCGAMDCASAPDASPPARGGSVVLSRAPTRSNRWAGRAGTRAQPDSPPRFPTPSEPPDNVMGTDSVSLSRLAYFSVLGARHTGCRPRTGPGACHGRRQARIGRRPQPRCGRTSFSSAVDGKAGVQARGLGVRGGR